ncbi:Peptidase-M48 domain-containing protein [Mycena kentingensis (nom. inval.)]|nr:Peptidase-M48 domain-containing protein [Mycena kentingensis (nom. inval.)]
MNLLRAIRRPLPRPPARPSILTRGASTRPSGRKPAGPITRPEPFKHDRATYIGATIGVVLGTYWISHIEKTPETGRRRFMNVSPAEEEELRKQALEETLEQFKGRVLPTNHPTTQLVRRITRRILKASELGRLKGDSPAEEASNYWGGLDGVGAAEVPRPPTLHADKEWVVLVVDDMRFVNAFAAPGLVCVSTGIMPMAKNEEGLAAIIGHEIGHVTMRHSAEHLSKMKLYMPFMAIFYLMGLDPFISNAVIQFFYTLPHSRALEHEADTVGLKLMSRACYDPAAAPRVFANLGQFEKQNGSGAPAFLSTHPSSDERVQASRASGPHSCYP